MFETLSRREAGHVVRPDPKHYTTTHTIHKGYPLMKLNELKTGNHYEALVNGRLQTVRLDEIKASNDFRCTNPATGRKLVYRSSQKFRREMQAPAVKQDYADAVRRGETVTLISPAPSVQNVQKPSGLADRLRAKPQEVSGRHVIITARAGTGKTTTLVEGMKIVRGDQVGITPSEQQAAIWDELRHSIGAERVAFVAFSKDIAEELKTRVPLGTEAMTMHSMGFRAVRQAFRLRKFNTVNKWRVANIVEEITGLTREQLKRKEERQMVQGVEALVSLCKQNLIDGSDQRELERLAAHYDVDLNGQAQWVFELVPQVLVRCKDVQKDGYLDYDDMIWLPIVLNLEMYVYDVLLVDEAQDLNRCQQALAKRAGKRLILCGDPRQAIFGFAGADDQSMPRLFQELLETERSCVGLSLTVTRRCGKAIVREAQELVPDIEAYEDNGEGKVTRTPWLDYRKTVQDRNMVLCRCNAPLVSECFRFIKDGRKATIRGKDIGAGLIKTIDKQEATDIVDLTAKLEEWYELEIKKEESKSRPDEARLNGINDRYECLICFLDGVATIEALKARIEAVFTDAKTDGVQLSSIHKAKGLEANRVYLIEPGSATVPLPKAIEKGGWELEQEFNLRYVAITRAKQELIYVK